MHLLLTQFGELRENEVSLIDFTEMEEEVESIVECIHHMALKEFMSRTIQSVWGWEVRTQHMFDDNHIHTIQDIVSLSQMEVNNLTGCGRVTRKEVYEVLCMYHIKLKYWNPNLVRNNARGLIARYKF
jgi:DNA-directed RNA polymerase alpha subunit